MDDDERVDLSTVDDELKARVGMVLDANAKIMMLCRGKAEKCFILAERAEELADQYREIGSLYVLAAKEHAQMLADTFDAEYNIEDGPDVDPEDEEDYAEPE